MTPKRLVMAAGLGSAAVLIAALGFQYIGGLAPCKMCLWQRYPHVAAVFVAALFFVFQYRPVAALGAAASLATAGIGFYHAGVERSWWEGPNSCTSGAIGGMSTEDLINQIMAAPMVRCDEIPWALWGLSMAGWNALMSLALAGLWMMALRRL
ncbi:MAG: disulfide bond formation protein B [Paracoccaceae bacterium]